jgi:hypothetical protein
MIRGRHATAANGLRQTDDDANSPQLQSAASDPPPGTVSFDVLHRDIMRPDDGQLARLDIRAGRGLNVIGCPGVPDRPGQAEPSGSACPDGNQ